MLVNGKIIYICFIYCIYIFLYIYIYVCVCSHFWCLSSTIKSIWNPIRSLKSLRSQCGFSIPTKASSVAQNVALGVAGTWQKGHHMLSNSAWRDPWSAKAYVCTSTYFHTHRHTYTVRAFTCVEGGPGCEAPEVVWNTSSIRIFKWPCPFRIFKCRFKHSWTIS